MADVNFSTLLPRILTISASFPGTAAIDYIREAAIYACEQTLAWKYIHPNIALVKGTRDYSFNPPNNTNVITISNTVFDGQPLRRITIDDLNDYYPQWIAPKEEEETTPVYISIMEPNKFLVYPVPDKAGTLSLIVTLKPTRDAVGMEETIVDALEDAIVYGTLSRLTSLPDRAWSDKTLAQHYGDLELRAISDYRISSNLVNTDKRIQIIPNQANM